MFNQLAIQEGEGGDDRVVTLNAVSRSFQVGVGMRACGMRVGTCACACAYVHARVGTHVHVRACVRMFVHKCAGASEGGGCC